MGWQEITSSLWRLLPLPCCLCGLRSHTDYNLCRYCQDSLPWQGVVCQTCALPLTISTTSSVHCGVCQQRPPLHSQLLAAFEYRQPLESLIYQFKFAQSLNIGLVLAKCFYQYLLQEQPLMLPDCLIPVPLHPKRIRERGYNQAALLCKHLSRWLSIPSDLYSCRRIRYTQAQTLVAPKARRRNIQGAFRLSPRFHARHVAIIDDVYTSGSTTRELTHMLKLAGVDRVDIWVIARAGLGRRV